MIKFIFSIIILGLIGCGRGIPSEEAVIADVEEYIPTEKVEPGEAEETGGITFDLVWSIAPGTYELEEAGGATNE